MPKPASRPRKPKPVAMPALARSASRGRVHDAALGPQIVDPALELERGLRSEAAVIDLAVVADRLDRVQRPLLVEAERRTHARGLAQQTLDARVLGLGRHLV